VDGFFRYSWLMLPYEIFKWGPEKIPSPPWTTISLWYCGSWWSETQTTVLL